MTHRDGPLTAVLRDCWLNPKNTRQSVERPDIWPIHAIVLLAESRLREWRR